MDEQGSSPTAPERAADAVVRTYRFIDRVLLAAKLFVLVGLGPILLLLAGEYLLGGIAFSLLLVIVGTTIHVRRRPSSQLSTAAAPAWLIAIVAVALLAGFVAVIATLS
jgi:hypothetical protein